MTTRLATPGAILLLVGVVLMWWGAGIFRGDTSRNDSLSPPSENGHDHSTPRFGGGSSGGGGGASGSF